MGSGKGLDIDLPLIMKFVALICCAIAVGLVIASTTSDYASRSNHVSNSLIYSTGSYCVILGFFFFWTIIKGPIDKSFIAIVLVCGCIFTVGGALGVILYKVDYTDSTHTYQLIGGIMALIAGITMLVDSLHNFGVF